MVRDILDAVHAEKFSSQNVAFGMGGGLLQKVNKDTISFATKLSYIEYEKGNSGAKFKEIMKAPATDVEKFSLPGKMRVMRKVYKTKNENDELLETYGPHTVFPAEIADNFEKGSYLNSMNKVYNNGLVEGLQWETFEAVRDLLNREWSAMTPKGSAVDITLLLKQLDIAKEIRRKIKESKSLNLTLQDKNNDEEIMRIARKISI